MDKHIRIGLQAAILTELKRYNYGIQEAIDMVSEFGLTQEEQDIILELYEEERR